MSGVADPRQVVLAADPGSRPALSELFTRELFKGWSVLTADSFEQVRFVLQHQGCDVLLVDESAYKGEDAEAFAWLARRSELPLLLLAMAEPAMLTFALANGVSQWLPRDLALAHPLLLAAALNQLAQITDLRRHTTQTANRLRDSRRQVDRLVNVLWRSMPGDVERRWFTQRHLLERLHEEIHRVQRYGHPLTIVLGEVQFGPDEDADWPESWIAERIIKAKRCCDVAGQYGPRGFMLVLAHTEEPGAAACCRRLEKALAQPTGPGGLQGPHRVCFGIAGYTPAVGNSKRLLSLAEQHLEAAKIAGEGIEAAV
jgi:GGDEF domain-containing protein